MQDNYRLDLIRATASLDLGSLERVVAILGAARQSNARVFVAGNGGSAANASHLVGHLRERGLNAYCLSDNIPMFSAAANDFGHENSFLMGVPKATFLRSDVVIVLSCSGDSANILRLLEKAKEVGSTKIAMLGRNGAGKASAMADIMLAVDSQSFEIVEDVHSQVLHMLRIALTS